MRSRLTALLAIAALLLLAAVVARGTSAVPVGQGKPLLGFLRLPMFSISQVPAGAGSSSGSGSGAAAWAEFFLWTVLLLPLILLGAAMLVALASSLRRKRVRMPSPMVPEDELGYADLSGGARLLKAVRAAQSALAEHAGGPPSDAVIAAWLHLEHAAAEHGTTRLPHHTPTEFTDLLRHRQAGVEPALDRLRGLYQRARFAAPGVVGTADADAARSALEEIVRALTFETAAR